jgi:glutathione S-transferase
MAKYVLVSFKTCPWVQRVAIVLREKKIDFEFRHIEADDRPDWFKAISPHNKVPVLRLDDKVSLFESGAIAEFLDDTTAPRLHPEDLVERAVNRAWIEYLPTFVDMTSGHAYADTEAEFYRAATLAPAAFEKLERGARAPRQRSVLQRRALRARRRRLCALPAAAFVPGADPEARPH